MTKVECSACKDTGSCCDWYCSCERGQALRERDARVRDLYERAGEALFARDVEADAALAKGGAR
jgi:hypothetical protein